MNYISKLLPTVLLVLASAWSLDARADGPHAFKGATLDRGTQGTPAITTVYENGARTVHFFLQPRPRPDARSSRRIVGNSVYTVAEQLEPVTGMLHLATLTKRADGTKQLTVAGGQLRVTRTGQEPRFEYTVSLDPGQLERKTSPVSFTTQDLEALAARAAQLQGELSLPPQLLSRLAQLMSH